MATWNSTGRHDNSGGSGWPRGTRLGTMTTVTVVDGHVELVHDNSVVDGHVELDWAYDNSGGSGWPRGTRLGTMTTVTVVDGHVELDWAS